MYNIQQLRRRYEGKTDGLYFLAHLRWDGKEFYKSESTEGIMLVRRGGDFAENTNGKLQEFNITDDDADIVWGSTEGNYYPWPWFPNKKITAFLCVGICPGFVPGVYYGLEPENYITGSGFYFDNYVALTMDTCLRYPEFFKPIYE